MAEIAAFFLCLIGYRAVCQLMNWHPAPLVQITFHNYARGDDD